ncbi:MAG: hypothetical protein AAGM38_18250 [Pseudomonadota bacterium]
MAKRKPSALAAPFQGCWRVAEMDLWDQKTLDLTEPARLDIAGTEGEMRFIAIQAWLDIRCAPAPAVRSPSSSGEGLDEDDQRSGHSRVEPGTAGRVVGHLYLHMGDDPGFAYEPW